MPELPEAEITKRKLSPLRGKKTASFWLNWPRAFRSAHSIASANKDIKNRNVLGLSRKGKVIFLDLGKRLLAFHQRMSGSLQIKAPKEVKSHPKSKHVHVVVGFTDGTELRFEDPRKFGVVWYGTPEEVHRNKYISSLGPDALGVKFQDFKSQLVKHKGAIKPLLLRQDVLAGIGNIIADEMLWSSKIHPKRLSGTLKDSDLKNMHAALQRVLNKSIKLKGTTLHDWSHPDGKEGGFQEAMLVYDRLGLPCTRCKTKIARLVVGGRGTWVCKRCQK